MRENTMSKTNKETFYFSHDYNARNDIKIQALLVEHGAVGYGVYWIIVEILHEESEKKLKLNNLTYIAIARQASTSVEQVKAVVECCLEYELFTEDDGCFFSKRILKNIDKRMDISEKRAKAGRISANKRKKATSVEQIPTNANKEKEIKEKKRKEKGIVDTNVSMSDAEHPTQERIDYKALINFFNDETQGVFGKVMYPISKQRKDSIRARINEFGKDEFAEMIRKASESNFLKGDGNKGFVAKFDWMIRPTNFQKIIEGNYDNRDKGYSSGAKTSDEELMLHIRQGIARGIEENAI
jgi:hypothetical protein